MSSRALPKRYSQIAFVILIASAGVLGIATLYQCLSIGNGGIQISRIELCETPDTSELRVVRIEANRFRLIAPTQDPTHLCVDLEFNEAVQPRYLITRAEQEITRIEMPGVSLETFSESAPGKRTLSPIAVSEPIRNMRINLFLAPDEERTGSQELVIDELGVASSPTNFSNVERDGWSAFSESYIPVLVLLSLTLLAPIIAALSLERVHTVLTVCFAMMLSLAIGALALRQTYTPSTGSDFRYTASSFHLQNGNQSESLITGSRLLQGKGNTLRETREGASVINTYRMPGYPMFVAAAGWLFRVDPTDLVSLAASTVYLHVLAFALAVGLFSYSMSQVFDPLPTLLVVGALCWFPQAHDLTQNDSLILTCGLLIASSLCIFYSKRQAHGDVPLQWHLIVHLCFALYLLVRSDVIVGWAGVSLFLYWRRWRYLLIPALLFLTVGVGWGLYKVAHGSRFVMTTSNVGHVAFVGLWQGPEHKFVWEPMDASYDRWISSHGYTYMQPEANTFAFREVMRFWATYPGFAISNYGYRLYSYLYLGVWVNSLSLFPAVALGVIMRLFLNWIFFLSIVSALLLGYERTRTFLLAWPIFLNLPTLLLFQESGGRYVPFITCSFMFAAIPLLLETDFRKLLWTHKRKVRVVLGVGLLAWVIGIPMSWVLLSDDFRYWTPFLDPAKSSLSVFKPTATEAVPQ